MEVYSIVITIIAVMVALAFTTLFLHGNYATKILIKLGLKEKTARLSYELIAWGSCLNQLDFKADIVFLGDSITQAGKFQSCFKTKKIINLGYAGDSIDGMKKRVNMAKSVSPEKIFLMGGINSLNNNNLKISVKQYSSLLKTVKEALPDTEIYVQSVLPVIDGRKLLCSNKTIRCFNKELEKISAEYNAVYVDLFSLFVEEDTPKKELYHDNVHISKSGYDVWTNHIKKYIE